MKATYGIGPADNTVRVPARCRTLGWIGRTGAVLAMAAGLFAGWNSPTFARGDGGGGGNGGTPATPLKTAKLYAVGISHPGGGVWIGHHLWVTDRFTDVCKLAAPTRPAAGLLAETVCDSAQHQAGQPAYDPIHHDIYVPDGRQASPGVWRIAYDAEKDTITVGSGYYNVSTDTVLLAPGKLAGLRTTSTALGPDGNLYVGSVMTGAIKRIKTPAGKTQTVDTVGSAVGPRTVLGLAFVGRDLYLAEPVGLSVIHNAPACAGNCTATLVPGVPAVDTTAVAARGNDTLYFSQATGTVSHAAHRSGASTTANAKHMQVMRLTLSTGKVALYADAGAVTPAQLNSAATMSTWAANCSAGTCPFSVSSEDGSGLTVDSLGNVYVGDDPFNGNTRNTGRVWVIAGS